MRVPYVAFLAIVLSLLYACGSSDSGGNIIIPVEGRERVERGNLAGFSEISLSSGFSLILTQGEADKVEVVAPVNLHPYIEASLAGSTLVLKRKDGISFAGTPEIKIYVVCHQLSKLAVSTLADVTSINAIQAEDFSLAVTTSAIVSLAVECTNLTVTADSNATVELEGKASTYIVSAVGGSKLGGFLLSVQTLGAHLAESSTLDVSVARSLSVVASGSSILSYKGSPTIISQQLTDGAQLVDSNTTRPQMEEEALLRSKP